jgi:hypothetical protein
MSFNKRFIDKETIKHYVNSGYKLHVLFNSDTIIFLDKTSSKVYDWYISGLTEDEIKTKLNKNG